MSTDAFGDKLGTFRGMYPCSYLLEDGHLAVGSKSVGYRCNSTSCARMIMIALNDIGSVNGVGATGLIISTTSGEDYVFKGFAGRDAVMKLVNDEKNKTLRGAPSTFTKSYATRVQHLRRSSFPTIPVNALPMGEFEKDDMQETLDIMKDMTKAVEQNKAIVENERSGKSERPPPDVRKSVTTKSMRFFAAVMKNRTDKDLDKAWAKLKTEKNKTYPTVVLSGIKLNYTIDEFYNIFWSHGATHPQEDYKRDVQGDKDLTTTDWIDTGDKFTLSRTQDYQHPNDAPVGPPMAHSVTEQTLQKYGSHGLVITNSTTVEGIPMADCFVMEDRILASKTNGGILITVDMGLNFVKRTVFRGVIEKAAKGGSKKSWKAFFKWIESLPDYPK
uniref:VASt domain-containing protein n=1 Tax=Ditylum brightwellii TaxID=49249 RepID=A0A6U3QAF8_9STRA|mmetsp:Transcript_18804/g.28056  ORF Transcript_18804/g.28056 Transcript_18804/m.28056 type:complete len:387 (+) Transcript_18804:33-1193(+)